jgi:hypothetical protein
MAAPTESSSLPLLFGKVRRALGWQGYVTEIPENWNPGKFSGKRAGGDLRVDDENGVRLELRWEQPKKTPDVEKSVSNFLEILAKQAKKRGDDFSVIEDAKVVSRSKKRKDQVISFGWEGAPDAPSSCGFGAAWFCPTCDRVTFAHVLGHRGEKPAKIERLASEILTPLECHGEGGWDSWSLYDLRIEIPTEFELGRAQVLLNKIELEWVRPRPVGLYGWGRRAERLKLSRFPAATALLADSSLKNGLTGTCVTSKNSCDWGCNADGSKRSRRSSLSRWPQRPAHCVEHLAFRQDFAPPHAAWRTARLELRRVESGLGF